MSNSIFLSPTDEEEILALIASLKNNTAAVEDGLKAEPIKAISRIIAAPLAHRCNVSLSTGCFPKRMKVARVCVIHKGGVQSDLNNYRPISVLPVFSKILEHIINSRLTSSFTKHKIITEKQFGFQKNKSTEMALVNIKDKIITNIENKQYAIGIFLDFQKSF